jgi:hypothetical protein
VVRLDVRNCFAGRKHAVATSTKKQLVIYARQLLLVRIFGPVSGSLMHHAYRECNASQKLRVLYGAGNLNSLR